MLTREQVLDRWPYINDHDLKGALWIPGDIIVNAQELTKLLAQLAMEKGDI